MSRTKFRIVQFNDGKYGAEKMWFFGLIGSGEFLDMYGANRMWSFKQYVDNYGKTEHLHIVDYSIEQFHKYETSHKVKRYLK